MKLKKDGLMARRTCILIVLAGTIFLLQSCQQQNNTNTGGPEIPGSFELVWSDEFDQQKLDTSQWAFRTDNKHRSIQKRENVSLRNGSLRLQLQSLEVPEGGKNASGAGIVSKRRFKYGYYEVKARIGDGQDDDRDGKTDEGWHHSFWAMAAEVNEKNEVSTTYPGIRRTEIDCFENSSEHIYDSAQSGLNVFTQHVIIWNEKGKETERRPNHPQDITAIPDFDTNQWHRYGFAWSEEEIRFYVDGALTQVAKYPANQFVHDDINIWLTAIAANWNSDDQENSEAYYDYIRYYQPK